MRLRFNVVAALEMAKAAAPLLLASGEGNIINISSSMDHIVARGLLAYGTAKAALSHLTRLLASELAPQVRVNAIAPGVVETDGLKPAMTDEVRAHVAHVTPLRRLGTAREVAATAVWLASRAASYVTGRSSGSTEEPTFRGFPVTFSIPDRRTRRGPLESQGGWLRVWCRT
jgi:7-alpha-hydroxysteroid dehydrogenase